MRTIEEVIKEISDNAQYRNGEPTYLFEGYDVEKALCEILEIHKKEKPQGEWEYTTHHARRYRICPFCKCEKEDDRSADWFYCWHCGADMRGEEE